MAKRANILFLFPDQLRADFLKCYGADFINTPAMDLLCREGVRFTNAYSPSPLCVPARASLLTGQNCIKTGVFHNDHWLRPDHDTCGVRTWPSLLSEAGYHTEAIGKMHFYPWDINEGFNHRVIADDKRHFHIQDDYADYLKQHGLAKYPASDTPGYLEHKGAVANKFPPEHQVDKWVGDRTCEFLENYKSEKPFALMVGFPGPHCPYDPPLDSIDMYKPDNMPDSFPDTAESRAFLQDSIKGNRLPWNGVDYTEFTESQRKRVKAYYAALVTLIDNQIGRIIDVLRKKNQLENTVIILSSDHGDYVGDFSMVGKTQFFEPASHVPLIVKYPGVDGGREIGSTVSLTDIQATILAIAGIKPDAANRDAVVLDGLPLEQSRRRDYLFAPSIAGYMIVKEEWKYCRYHNGVHSLHNIKSDPKEQKNLIHHGEFRAMISEFDALLFQEIFDSIQTANFEKVVNRGGLVGEGTFGLRGWQRTYPEKAGIPLPHQVGRK